MPKAIPRVKSTDEIEGSDRKLSRRLTLPSPRFGDSSQQDPGAQFRMTDLVYSLRAHRWCPETTYRQHDDALHWSNNRGRGSIAFSEIRKVQVYKIRYFGSRVSYWRCILHGADGQKIYLQAAHHVAFRRIEDRTATYIPFIKRLESRIAVVNPNAHFEEGTHWLGFVDSCRGTVIVLILDLVRLVRLDRAQRTSSWLLRRIGPLLKGHRIARANLLAAYPEKSGDEIEQILAGTWDNLGRVFAEYAHLDRLWDYDPDRSEPGRILLDEASRKRFVELLNAKGPALIFGAHLANWELLAWAVGSHHGEIGIVYRQTRIAPMDRKLLEIRARSKASYITANAQAVFLIKNALQRGAGIGMLVDEHFSRGIDVTFFGRVCKVTPLFARYARQYDCPIHGGRLVRLPDGKFRLDVTEALVAPRDAAGKIDVAATMQMITSIIEGWVREHPEQWLWSQRRWR